MATKTIKMGTAENWLQYDDADADNSMVVEQPILGIEATQGDEYVTLNQLQTSIIATDAEAFFFALEF